MWRCAAGRRFVLDKFRHHNDVQPRRCYCPDMTFRSLHLAALCLAASILAGCAASTDVESRDFLVEQNSSLAPVRSIADERITKLVNKTSAAYVTLVVSDSEKARDATSTRAADRRGKPATSGSGFVVDSSGYVVTAAHVALEKGNSVSARAANVVDYPDLQAAPALAAVLVEQRHRLAQGGRLN